MVNKKSWITRILIVPWKLKTSEVCQDKWSVHAKINEEKPSDLSFSYFPFLGFLLSISKSPKKQ